MSTLQVLQDISLYLRRLLVDHLSRSEALSEQLRGLFGTPTGVSLDSPARLKGPADSNDFTAAISLYLLQATPNGQLNNQPLIAAGPGRQFYPPLYLDLRYLLTPLLKAPEDNLLVMGAVLQIMAASPVIRQNFLRCQPPAGAPEVRVTLAPVTLEEITRIWGAFSQPYRLSMCYDVRSVAIDSLRGPEEGPPVVERLVDVHQIVAEAEGG